MKYMDLFLKMKQIFAQRFSAICFYLYHKPGLLISSDKKINLTLVLIAEEIQSIFAKSIIGPPMDGFQ